MIMCVTCVEVNKSHVGNKAVSGYRDYLYPDTVFCMYTEKKKSVSYIDKV